MIRLELTTDKTRIRSFLERDRLWGAYALGDLEPGLFERCQWVFAVAEGEDTALGLLFTALDPPGYLLYGDAAGVDAILSSGLTPGQAFLVTAHAHWPLVERYYTVGKHDEMVRMVVGQASFRGRSLTPRPPLPPGGGRGWGMGGIPRRVTLADLAQLNALYASEQGPDAFAPFQIEQGVFYALETNGRIVAAAGTHLVSPSMGVAAVGNVYTDSAYRGRGLAQLCTSAVVTHCFELGIRDVVLNVNTQNEPAKAAYRRLGFREYCLFIEGVGERGKKTED